MKYSTLIVGICFLTQITLAKTEIEPQIEKLKSNAENSENNYKQYQDNLDIVDKNIKQAKDATKELKRLEKQLLSNVKNVENNKIALNKQEQSINQLKTKEQAKIDKENKQIADLQKLMDRLLANKAQREKNLIVYDKKINEINEERKAWDTQVQEMATIQAEIKSKQQLATKEATHWKSKRKDYQAEAKKWKKETYKHAKLYKQYK